MRETCDICIIGSGAGGGTAAWHLAKAGFKVILLERGSTYKTTGTLHDEYALCRRGELLPPPADAQREVLFGENPAVTGKHLWTATVTGGGTRIWSGFFMRMNPDAFTPATRFGTPEGATHTDWPFGYNELAPYYDRIEAALGIPLSPLSLRDDGTPIPKLKAHAVSSLIDATAQKSGLSVFDTPRAVLPCDWKGRKACGYSGLCGSYLCCKRARAGTHEVFLHEALTHKNFKMLTECRALTLETAGGRVRSVAYVNRLGMRGTISAKTFICAAGAIETPRLLLANGIANSSSQVGKNLTFVTPCEVTGYFPRDAFPAPSAGDSPFVQRTTRDWENLPGEPIPYKRGGTVIFLFPHPNPINRMLLLSQQSGGRIYGEALQNRAKEFFSYHHLTTDGFIDYLPSARSFVTLSSVKKDSRGVPIARIAYRPHPASIAAAQAVARRVESFFTAMGAVGTALNPAPYTSGELVHGTCRIGTDRSTSVCDPLCRSHDLENLYITDSSFMPSGIGVPSTFTIMANALRVAEGIEKRG